MADNPIKLVNENGRIVGKDPDTGDTVPVEFESIQTEKLSYSNVIGVETASELESAFNNLSRGETIFIHQKGSPYRTTQWLDIDVNEVTIVGESQFAADGQALIKPADGADVGGIRIGNNTAVEDIEIRSIGYDGNESTMDNTVKDLDGVRVNGATGDILVKNSYFTRTHPYHEHGSGGSGCNINDGSGTLRCVNNVFFEIGDRAMEAFNGANLIARGNISRDGFDRMVSWAGDGHRGTSVGNLLLTNAEGSMHGVNGQGYAEISGNMVVGNHRGLCRVTDTIHTEITGNVAKIPQTESTGSPGVDMRGGDSLTVTGNYFEGQSRGVRVQNANRNVTVTGNTIRKTRRQAIRITDTSSGDVTIGHNYIEEALLDAGSGAIGVTTDGAEETVINGNIVTDVGSGSNSGGGMDVYGPNCTVVGNRIWEGANGIVNLDVEGNNCVVVGNTIENEGWKGILIDGSECIVGLNSAYGPSGNANFQDNGTDNLWVGNYSHSSTHWNLSNATTPRVMANWPNPDGYGYVVTTPDGSNEYEIRVDNNGNVVTDQL